jgi:hypothetical protein
MPLLFLTRMQRTACWADVQLARLVPELLSHADHYGAVGAIEKHLNIGQIQSCFQHFRRIKFQRTFSCNWLMVRLRASKDTLHFELEIVNELRVNRA